jgi:hypothetical protein
MKNIQLSILLYLLLSVVLTAPFISCGGKNIREFPYKKNLESDTLSVLKSAKQIDRGDTYEFYFKVIKKSECLKVTLSASISTGGIQSREKRLPVYYIIEKGVSVAAFSKERGFVFSQLKKNYDTGWSPKQVVEFCPAPDDPVSSLDQGDICRIRFTSFDNGIYRFLVTIESDGEIEFTVKP